MTRIRNYQNRHTNDLQVPIAAALTDDRPVNLLNQGVHPIHGHGNIFVGPYSRRPEYEESSQENQKYEMPNFHHYISFRNCKDSLPTLDRPQEPSGKLSAKVFDKT